MIKIEEDSYFSAKDARRVSDKVYKSKITAEIDRLYYLINEARWDGKTEITIKNETFQEYTISFLKNRGFNVRYISDDNITSDNNIIISW